MLQSCIEFDGRFHGRPSWGGLLEAPLYPLKSDVLRGHPVFQGQVPSGPPVIRPLLSGQTSVKRKYLHTNTTKNSLQRTESMCQLWLDSANVPMLCASLPHRHCTGE